MKQTFKAIYFPGGAKTIKQDPLTLAFGEKDGDLYDFVRPLSSHEVRELLGYQSSFRLRAVAESEGLPLNTYCLWVLRKKMTLSKKVAQGTLFPPGPDIPTLNPIHATFKGGRQDPLHNWFPYIEGYSPDFVRTILKKYAPKAQIVYDPFSGAGTTPLVASDLGLTGYYSEINPLLQFVTDVKITARSLSNRQRDTIIGNLRKIRENLSGLVRQSKRDGALSNSYIQTFGQSKFFDDYTYDLVLRMRTLVDNISSSSPVTGQLISVAILSSLVPSSLLQRAGDVRYKTPYEIATKKVDFLEAVQQHLHEIEADLSLVEPFPSKPILLTEDARNLDKIPDLFIDTVITSPPYLNGTNYFRNTKVELWFLRSLLRRSDLAEFRERSVAAGINDISSRRISNGMHVATREVVLELSKHAYDQRIPKMVEFYFQDMARIFSGLRRHLTTSNVITIDIGDSFYGSVHVPTDMLLTKILEDLGYKIVDAVHLRKRASRGGAVLKQVLLVFHYSDRLKNVTVDVGWENAWRLFKEELPHKSQPWSKRNWGHPLHSLCSYQGKMKPALAHFLVNTFARSGQKILDPFAGVGTIPFEAALNGITNYAFDISPAALVIAKGKLGRPDPKKLNDLLDRLGSYLNENEPTDRELEETQSFGFNSQLSQYYEHRTLREVLLARRFFGLNPPQDSSEALVMASLLHILHGNRPYALSRRSHGITPFSPTGDFEYRPLIPRLREKVQRSLETELPHHFIDGKVFFQDATSWWPREVDDLDAIITSPPFFDSTRFHLANWIRLWFAGWNSDEFKTKPLSFVEERQKQSFNVYIPVLRQSRERLKKGGVLVMHLGRSRKCNMANEMARVAKRWFTITDIFTENVEDGESHGIRDKGTVSEHQYLVLM